MVITVREFRTHVTTKTVIIHISFKEETINNSLIAKYNLNIKNGYLKHKLFKMQESTSTLPSRCHSKINKKRPRKIIASKKRKKLNRR